MADSVTFGGFLVHNADVVAPYDNLAGAAAGTLDLEIFFQGIGSIGQYIDDTLDGLLIDAGAATNFGSNTFYFIINCGIVGLLDTKANGGFRIRFCGDPVTDWFEVYVGGSDSWPDSFAGGWTLFIVDIEEARSVAITNGWVNGSPVPLTSAIRYAGYAAITAGTKPRMVDNTWMDATVRVPANTAAIKVQGRNTGVSPIEPWSWDSVVAAFEVLENPVARYGPGGSIILSGAVTIGAVDAVTHEFTDKNKTVLWADAEFGTDALFFITALGGSGPGDTTNVNMGLKTGTGDDATGAQGGVIQANPNGVSWSMQVNANVNTWNLYGITFQHGGTFNFDQSTVSCISVSYIDCNEATVTDSEQLRVSVIAPNTADGVPFMSTANLADIVFSSFEFADGHGVELIAAGAPSPGAHTSKGNTFTNFGADETTDAAIYNNSGDDIEITVTSGGDSMTVRNASPGTSNVVQNISVTLTGIEPNTEVRVYLAEDFNSPIDTTELAGIEDTASPSEFTFSAAAGTIVDIVIFHVNFVFPPNNRIKNFTVPTTDTSFPITQIPDRNFSNP